MEAYRGGFSSRTKLLSSIAAVKYLGTHHPPIDDAEFDKECGVGTSVRYLFTRSRDSLLVGIELSLSDIAARVNAYITSKAPTSWSALSGAIGDLKSTDLRWASPLDVKNAVEKAFTDLFGSKEEAKAKVRPDSRSDNYNVILTS